MNNSTKAILVVAIINVSTVTPSINGAPVGHHDGPFSTDGMFTTPSEESKSIGIHIDEDVKKAQKGERVLCDDTLSLQILRELQKIDEEIKEAQKESRYWCDDVPDQRTLRCVRVIPP
jgi:hypothetical protein